VNVDDRGGGQRTVTVRRSRPSPLRPTEEDVRVRRIRGSIVGAAVFAAASALAIDAHAYQHAEYSGCAEPGSARLEIAPWIGLGLGSRRNDEGVHSLLGLVDFDLGLTAPVADFMRFGAFGSVDGTGSAIDTSTGVRLEFQTGDLAPNRSSFFRVPGRWSLLFDAGFGHRFATTGDDRGLVIFRIAAGFTAPNRLGLYPESTCRCDDPDIDSSGHERCRPKVGMVSGARPFVTIKRAFHGDLLEVVGGLEFEFVGALWWIVNG
jgi:hypothetical protein